MSKFFKTSTSLKSLRVQVIYWGIILFAALSIVSCSTTKYVPKDAYLLDKVHIKTDTEEFGSSELNAYVSQLPNSKMFWLFRTQLAIYNLSGRDSTRWINRQLRKIGEAPVIFDSTLVYRTDRELSRFLINKGYINVDVKSEVVKKKRKTRVTYTIKGNEPYRIRNYNTDIPDSVIYEDLHQDNGLPRRLPGEQLALRTPLINEGMLFDRSELDKERDRISRLLRNRGYYAFDKSYISYDADSSLNAHAVDLTMQMYLYPELLPAGIFAEGPHHKYYIDRVFIYTDYDPLRVVNQGDNYLVNDSVVKGKYTVYSPYKKPSVRPDVLLFHNYMNSGGLYSQIQEEMTHSAYSGLSAINNTEIRYEEFMRNDTAFLDCHILTMPMKKQSVSFSVEGTNSAGDFGVASSIGYTHRNLFRGSESFNIRLRGAYEAISGVLAQNYIDFGIETSIQFPKVLFPFLSHSLMRRMRASTAMSFGYNFQTRPEYDRRLSSGGLKYIWQNRGATETRHQLNLIDINYISVPRISESFLDKLPDGAELFGYTNQFIVGTTYIYSYSTFNPFQKQKDAYSLRSSIESAGNILYGISDLFNIPKNNNSYELFGVRYAQYLKGEIDFSKTVFLDKYNSIAWRVGAGIAYPYGNDILIPFEKRYYSGGANSVRGWAVRTLGPGKYRPNENTTFYNHTGDIKLDLNIEYRTKFFWKFELAAYIDAGNIWTIRNYDWQEGGLFKFNSFYKEIAMSYGLGLRLDFDFFLVRFDTGFKAYNPAKEGADRWAILHPNFGENFAWHFAVGYPF